MSRPLFWNFSLPDQLATAFTRLTHVDLRDSELGVPATIPIIMTANITGYTGLILLYSEERKEARQIGDGISGHDCAVLILFPAVLYGKVR